MSWLLDLNLFALGVLACGGGALLFALGALPFDGPAPGNGGNAVAGANLGFLAPLAGVVLVFVTTLTWLQYNRLQSATQREATRLILLAESAASLGEPSRTHLFEAIAGYARAVAGPEWEAMARGERSEFATQRMGGLVRAYAAAEASTQREWQILRFGSSLVRELGSDRESRLQAAAAATNPALLGFLGVTVVLSVAQALFLRPPTLSTKLAMGALFTGSMMLVALYAFVLSHPFAGPARFSSAPFDHVAQRVGR
ncbi:MAG: DUF4239 domain-containing protein [Alphaproteobacteria bacterium]|nr:DUF4239 domain-containing protein [Alphaproteobacteria bacterium]